MAGVLPPGGILRDQENKKESEEEGKGESNSKVSQESDMRKQTNEQLQKSKESYEKLIKEYPSIFHRVTLGHIASFLGITRPSLSRIRSSR